MRGFIAILFIGLIGNLFAQDISPTDQLSLELKKVKTQEDAQFQKIREFFYAEEYDSTLVYSNKYLSRLDANNKLIQFCHYFRAYSAEEKGLLDEAKLNYSLIPVTFALYQFVQMKLGGVELSLENYQNALDHFLFLEETKLNPKQVDRAILLNDIGICFLHLEDFDKSETYLKNSSELLIQDSTNTDILISTYTNLANLFYNQYKDDEAIPYFLKAYELSKKSESFEVKMNTAINMSVVEENRKDLARALVYRKEFDQWKDSLNNQNKVWEIAQVEKKHIAEQGKKREEVLEAENRTKVAERNGFIYASVLLCILLGTGVYFYIQKLRSNRIILKQKKELAVLNATKDRIFSVVSHDLRSNVNGLRLSSSKLTKDLEEENYAELRELVRNNGLIANSTYTLLDNLLNWAMIQTEQLYFNIESVNCHSIVEQVSFNYLPLMEGKRISFENTVPRKLHVQADIDSLKIILRNLIDNAIKYSSKNGAIHISVSEVSNNRCEIVIADQGNGMTKELVEALLEPSATGEVIGKGLGLHLCKELIDKNNGEFTVQSKLGEGSKVGVILNK